MAVERTDENPLITPADIPPSCPDLKVVCAFNAAATRRGDETILLLRIAEAVRDVAPDEVAVPVVLACDGPEPMIHIERLRRDTPGLDLSDRRAVILGDRCLLSSLSHLRVARSTDGIHFTIDPRPALFPCGEYEEYGIEDPRITFLDARYYINYSAVSRWGIAVGLASTTDFVTFTRHGLIFGPENKNVAIFPERLHGQYVALHRPSSYGCGASRIWLSASPDLHRWGGHRPVMERRPGMWDSLRIGAGGVPFRTEAGWLSIYHGVNEAQGYCLGAVLLDGDDPGIVRARADAPLLAPDTPYERSGFFGNAVFTCGTIADAHGMLHIYYGAADESICHARVPVAEVLAGLTPVR